MYADTVGSRDHIHQQQGVRYARHRPAKKQKNKCEENNMRKMNNQHKNKRMNRFALRISTWVMVLAILVQSLSVGVFALASDLSDLLGRPGTSDVGFNGNGKFDSDETIARLKKDFLKSLNQDLLKKVEDYQLKGEVGVIVTFSDNSLISSYTASKSKGSYESFRQSALAAQLLERL